MKICMFELWILIKELQDMFYFSRNSLSNSNVALKNNQASNGYRIHDLRETSAMLYQLSYELIPVETGSIFGFDLAVRIH